MDINYILGREQTSRHNAQVAASSGARASHRGLAAAYGQLLADSTFPHRDSLKVRFRAVDETNADRWDDDGGTVSTDGPPSIALDVARPPDKSFLELARAVERNERLLALAFADGKVSPKSFKSRSLFFRQDRAKLPDASPVDHAEKRS